MVHKRQRLVEQVYTATGKWVYGPGKDDYEVEQFQVMADNDEEAELAAEDIMTSEMAPGGKLIRVVRGDHDDPGTWREGKQPKRLTGKQLKRLVESVIQEAPASADVSEIWAEAAAMGIERLVGSMDTDELASHIDDASDGYGNDMPYPARIEDIDAYAQSAAEQALTMLARGSDLTELLARAIAQAMRRGF